MPDQAYTVDLKYPSAFVFGQAPLFMQWAAASAGTPGPSPTGPFTYCDLGCGDGFTLNLLAATYPGARFIGVDFNPDHLRRASELAGSAGLVNVEFREARFTELGTAGIPPMDYIAVHGVYTWVDEAVRTALHEFVRSNLKPGGLLGLQYSTLPGSAVYDPLFNYVKWFAEHIPGDSVHRFAAGLEQLQRLRPHAAFFRELPGAGELLDNVSRHAVNALVHDVLNRSAHSFYSHEVHEAMAALGLRYAGTGDLRLNHPALSMSRAAYAALEAVAGGDERLRLMAQDLILNTRSRFDVFHRPAAAPGAGAVAQGLRAVGDFRLRRMGVADNLEVRRRASSEVAVDLTSPVHTAVLAAVGDGSPSIDEVLNNTASDAVGQPAVESAIKELLAARFLNVAIGPAQEAEHRADRRYRFSSPLNSILLDETIHLAESVPFASQALGTVLMIPAEERMCLAAWLGRDLAQVWNVLERANRRPVDRRGGPIQSAGQFRAEIEARVPKLIEIVVPWLLRYGVLEDDGPAL